MKNLLCRVSRSAQPFVATLVRTIFAQALKTSAEEVQAQVKRVILQLEDRFPDVAQMLEEAAPGITAFATLPVGALAQDLVEQPLRNA